LTSRYNGRAAFTATVHEPGDAPAPFWRLIALRYPDGRQVSIVYAAEPADARELPRLMWQLQCAAGAYGFEITVTADGITTQAPPISLRRGRAVAP
jgi:hypothetical protein